MSAVSRKKKQKTFCLQETSVCFARCLHLTAACVRRETPPMLSTCFSTLSMSSESLFPPPLTLKNHPVLLFFARLNVLAVQTGVQFQPLHMNAPQRFRVGSLSSLSPCASGSGKTKPPVILAVAGALRSTLYGRGMKGSKDVTPKETSADIALT